MIRRSKAFFPSVVLCGVWLCANSLWAQPLLPVPIGSSLSVAMEEIAPYTTFLEDPTDTLDLWAVLAREAQFRPIVAPVPNFRATQSAYWLHFRWQNSGTGRYLLELGSAFLDSVSVYEVVDHRLVKQTHTGDHFPFEHRPLISTRFYFELAQQPAGVVTDYYVRVESSQPLFFGLRVGSWKVVAATMHRTDFLQGMLYGVMLIMILYNLFLYFGVRDRNYLYYVAYSISILLFTAFITGYFFEYLWPNVPLINHYAIVSTSATLVFSALFTYSFLDLKQLEWGRLVLCSQVCFGLVVGVFDLVGWHLGALVMGQAGLLIFSFSFLVLGVWRYRSGYSPALFYLVAWTALGLGMVAGALEGIVPWSASYYFNPIQVGAALEMALLSFALAARIRHLNALLEYSQQKQLAHAYERERLVANQNALLEERVAQRTKLLEQNQAELKAYYEEKQLLEQFRRDTMKMLVHDMKSALSVVINLGEKKLVRMAGQKILTMVNNLLSVQQYLDKGLDLEYSEFDVQEMAENVLEMFSVSTNDRQLNLSLHFEHRSVVADRGLMERIFENLITNAIKYSLPKGSIELGMRAADQHRWLFWVADTGVGIAPELHESIFEQYIHPHKRPLGLNQSTGLGLAFCKIAVEAHGGKIWVESAVQEGSKFYFYIPQVPHALP